MDDLLSLGPALLVPVLTGGWLAAAALVALFVGRAVRLADRRSTHPAPASRPSRRGVPASR